MSTPLAAAVQPNGARIAPEVELQFLDKLLRIRDDVLAGRHPRITLPPAALEQLARVTAQHPLPSMASKPTTNGTLNPREQTQALPPRPENPPQSRPSSNEFSSRGPPVPRPFSAKSASSGIDPVLLTKSDQLIRAELQLKRQQIERVLKDQCDKKGRGNDVGEETYLDVEDALAKAQALVKPLSGLRPAAPVSDGSSSFDENSYYSSKANSWSSDENDGNQSAHSANAVDPLTSQSKASPDAPLTAAKPAGTAAQPAQPTVIDLDEEPYEPAEDIEVYEPEAAQAPEDVEESDYSPPPAASAPSVPHKGRPRQRRNEAGNSNGSSRRQSPTGNAAPVQNPRKRRREEKREERRRQQANKRPARSPEPYIKEEPQSPPPFAAYPDAQPNKRRALQASSSHDIEALSGREGRIQPTYYREQDESPRAYRVYEEPISSPTVVSVPQRRLERDEHDLRRVASLQSMRRPYSPGAVEPYHTAEPRLMRSASHAYMAQPVETVYRETSAHPSGGPRYMRERSRSPVQEYLPRARSPVLMAPPPDRIVYDQYGNRYIAAPVDARESVAPVRRVEAEPYYGRAVTREPMMRAPGRAAVYDDEGLMMMPPPPQRRYVEAAAEAEMMEARPYLQREASRHPLDVDYAARGVVERRPVIQYEEMGPPRDYAPRAYSVRPEVVRREFPDEYAPLRHESVAPRHRYVSVAAPRPREVSVVHQEARAYPVAPHGRRYVEDGGERPAEVAQEPYSGETRRMRF